MVARQPDPHGFPRDHEVPLADPRTARRAERVNVFNQNGPAHLQRPSIAAALLASQASAAIDLSGRPDKGYIPSLILRIPEGREPSTRGTARPTVRGGNARLRDGAVPV